MRTFISYNLFFVFVLAIIQLSPIFATPVTPLQSENMDHPATIDDEMHRNENVATINEEMRQNVDPQTVQHTNNWIKKRFQHNKASSAAQSPHVSSQPPANTHHRGGSVNDYVFSPGIVPHQGRRNTLDLPYSGQIAIPKVRNRLVATGINALIEFMGSIFFYLPSYIGSDPSKGDGYVAAVYAASLTVAVFAFAQGQFNHGITFSHLLQGAISPEQAALFVLAQYAAGAVAGGISFAATGQYRSVASLHGISTGQGFLVELLGSIFLQFIVMMSSVMKHQSSILAPLFIGSAFLAVELFGIPLTGGSYNGGRQFGSAVVAGNWHSYDWIYHVAPLVAAPVSVFLFKLLQLAQQPTDMEVSFGPGLAARREIPISEIQNNEIIRNTDNNV